MDGAVHARAPMIGWPHTLFVLGAGGRGRGAGRGAPFSEPELVLDRALGRSDWLRDEVTRWIATWFLIS
jgi:hypothetical protein